MGSFRSEGRDRGYGGNRSSGNFGRFGGRSSGGRGGFKGRDSGGFGRGRQEMHEVTCDKCKKLCEVPFKPSKDKPVFCSDCFRKDGNSSFSPSQSSRGNSPSQGIPQEQFKEINKKLDKILGILETIEIEEEDEDVFEDDGEEINDKEDIEEEEDTEDEDDEELEIPKKKAKK